MKSLERVQKLSKIISIFVQIIFVCCIVGLVGSVLGIIGNLIIGNDAEVWAQISRDAQVDVSFNMAMCYCVVGAILSAGEVALYYYVKGFYKKELAVGTPFNKEIVKNMQIIGILHIAIPFGTLILSSIVMAIFRVNIDFSNFGDIGIGLAYLALSLVFDYGADLRNIEIETVKIRTEVQQDDLPKENVETPQVVVIEENEVSEEKPKTKPKRVQKKNIEVEDKGENETKDVKPKSSKRATKKDDNE